MQFICKASVRFCSVITFVAAVAVNFQFDLAKLSPSPTAWAVGWSLRVGLMSMPWLAHTGLAPSAAMGLKGIALGGFEGLFDKSLEAVVLEDGARFGLF